VDDGRDLRDADHVPDHVVGGGHPVSGALQASLFEGRAIDVTGSVPTHRIVESITDVATIQEIASGGLDVHFSSASIEWETDPDFFAELDRRHRFTLDVCATAQNRKCDAFFTKADDALTKVWTGSCFMNPPYGDAEEACKADCKKLRCLTCAEVSTLPGRKKCKPGCKSHRGHHIDKYVPGIADFMAKARQTAIDGTGSVVCLVPSRTDTVWWHDIVCKPHGKQVNQWVRLEKDLRAARFAGGLYTEIQSRKGRLTFLNPKREVSFAAPFPSAVIVFKPVARMAA
jgi:phage N-6-adenine-methyltransferase